jgi:VWFA-related protein
MVDDLGLSFDDMAFVRSSLRKFVDRQLQPGDLVAICRTGGGSGALQQFTVDKRVLLSVVDALRYNFNGRFGLSYFAPYISSPTASNIPGPNTGSRAADSFDVSYSAERTAIGTIGTLGAIDYVVSALRDLPGRKSIVVFSDGLSVFDDAASLGMNRPGAHGAGPLSGDFDAARAALRRLIDRANRSGTVIYTVNASGLQTRGMEARDNPASAQGGDDRGQIDIGLKQNLAYLADRTGGLAYQDGNDMNWALDRVLEDQQGYYLLGYRPPAGTLQAKNGRSEFHRIEVKVTRAGLHVRSRSGFYGETDDQTIPRFQSPVEQLRANMLSPFKSSGVDLRLTALYAEVPGHGPVVRNLLLIKATDLTWTRDAKGAGQARIVLVAIATGSGDRPLASIGRVYDVCVAPDKMSELMRDGSLYLLDVPVPKRGAYQIRVAVEDQATARVGSATQFLQVPDLKRAGFALTSVVLRDGQPSPDNPGLPGIAAARRQFPRGGSLEFLCAVENGRNKGPAADTDTRLRVLRDGKEVYSAPAHLVEVKGSGRAVAGGLNLAGSLTPGDYDLEVIATGRTGGKPASSRQWTDFTVLP